LRDASVIITFDRLLVSLFVQIVDLTGVDIRGGRTKPIPFDRSSDGLITSRKT